MPGKLIFWLGYHVTCATSCYFLVTLGWFALLYCMLSKQGPIPNMCGENWWLNLPNNGIISILNWAKLQTCHVAPVLLLLLVWLVTFDIDAVLLLPSPMRMSDFNNIYRNSFWQSWRFIFHPSSHVRGWLVYVAEGKIEISVWFCHHLLIGHTMNKHASSPKTAASGLFSLLFRKFSSLCVQCTSPQGDLGELILGGIASYVLELSFNSPV